MKRANSKYYVVWKGRQTGIFDSWISCKDQVDQFPQAEFLSFSTLEEAQQAFQSSYTNALERKRRPVVSHDNLPIADSLCVDASCRGNPGLMEYQCMHTTTRELIFREGPFPLGTNNIGEFLAVVKALAWLEENRKPYVIYTDSEIALKWLSEKKCQTKLVHQEEAKELWELIHWAEDWLKQHHYATRVLKWQTDLWGEIAADFNRK